MASGNPYATTKSKYSHRNPQSRTCLCSPTTHPGSFRCSFHKKPPRAVVTPPSNLHHQWESSISAAMKANSSKAILLQIMKPSSHDLHKRKTFQPKPTRFSSMNANRDAVAVVF